MTINCYYTTSRILVNGSKVDLFVTVGLPLMKKQIAQFYTDLNDVNKYFENTLQAFNVAKPAQTMDRNNLMPIENGTNRDSGMEQAVFYARSVRKPRINIQYAVNPVIPGITMVASAYQ